MIIRRKISRCIIDVNTQENLFLARSGCCIKNHSRILSCIRRIMAWARANNCLVISICRVYPYNNFNYSAYRKISYTILNNRFVFPVTSSTDIPINIWFSYQQIVLYSRSDDPFNEPLIDRLLSEANIEKSNIIGAIAEESVCAVTLGLLQRGKKVSFIEDAVGGYDHIARRLLRLKIKEKGANIIEAKDIAGTSHLKQISACGCASCRSSEKIFVHS